MLPPELGNLDLTAQKQVFKADSNPWVTPIADQFQLGVSHVFEYIRSETYKYILRMVTTILKLAATCASAGGLPSVAKLVERTAFLSLG